MPIFETLNGVDLVYALLLFGLCTAVISSRYGNNAFIGFIGGAVLGPFGLALLMSTIGKACPRCMKRIHRKAVVCPYCQGEQPKEATPAKESSAPAAQTSPGVMTPVYSWIAGAKDQGESR